MRTNKASLLLVQRGKNLDILLSKVGLALNDVYITNILKYRPPENRGPSPEEINTIRLG